MGKTKTTTPIPTPTSWIETVPGADPPADVLLVLLHGNEDDQVAANLGFFHGDVKSYVDLEGRNVEATDGPVSKYHILTIGKGRIQVR